jgi:hypothetical protein
MTTYFARTKDGRCAFLDADTPAQAAHLFGMIHDIHVTPRAVTDVDDALYLYFGHMPQRWNFRDVAPGFDFAVVTKLNRHPCRTHSPAACG